MGEHAHFTTAVTTTTLICTARRRPPLMRPRLLVAFTLALVIVLAQAALWLQEVSPC